MVLRKRVPCILLAAFTRLIGAFTFQRAKKRVEHASDELSERKGAYKRTIGRQATGDDGAAAFQFSPDYVVYGNVWYQSVNVVPLS